MEQQIKRLLRTHGYEAVIAALIDACRAEADLQLAKYDNFVEADRWEERAQALENIQ